VVNAPASLARRVRRTHGVELEIPRQGGVVGALIKAIRPQQWAKNILVFLPIITSQQWFDVDAWRAAGLAFMAISLAASSLYLINDASDIDADRIHERKRTRPFASGALSLPLGLCVSLLLLAGGLALGVAAGAVFWVAVYLATSALYTFWFKRKMLLDVFVLGALYTIRVVLGGVATGYVASSWLLAFCCFFFLALALVKRAVEVDAVIKRGGDQISRRAYRASDGPILKMMGVGASFVSALVLALYTQSPEIAAGYREPLLLWALPAAVIFWLCRVWLKADRGEIHDDPLIFAFRDRASWMIGLVLAAAFAGAALAPPAP
jgi:4-hydroxybenzoate polyprenyltransferase